MGTTPSNLPVQEELDFLPVRLKELSWAPLPRRITRRASAGSFFHGVESENPIALESVSTIFRRHDFDPSGQGATAPARMERSGSGTTFSGSTPISVPRRS